MAVALALPVFAVGLVVALAAAATFARRLDRLGARFGLSEITIGLLTALAADGPEVSSALVALFKGAHDASVGVIVGSCTFNLAAMVGVSVLLSGCVVVSRRTLLLEGAVGLVSTATVIALLLGWLPVAAAVAVIVSVLVPYLVLVLGGHDLVRRLGLERLARLGLDRDAAGADGRGHHDPAEFATHRQLALMALDVALIIGGSFAMVEASLTLGNRWGVASGLVGALILGPVTSLPNALTGIRLGLAGRGAALVAEALNSNTINIVAGIVLPSIFVALRAHSANDRVDLALLAATTLVTIGLLARRGGMRRPGAGIVIGLYIAFVVTSVA